MNPSGICHNSFMTTGATRQYQRSRIARRWIKTGSGRALSVSIVYIAIMRNAEVNAPYMHINQNIIKQGVYKNEIQNDS